MELLVAAAFFGADFFVADFAAVLPADFAGDLAAVFTAGFAALPTGFLAAVFVAGLTAARGAAFAGTAARFTAGTALGLDETEAGFGATVAACLTGGVTAALGAGAEVGLTAPLLAALPPSAKVIDLACMSNDLVALGAASPALPAGGAGGVLRFGWCSST